MTRVVYMPGRSFRAFAEERLEASDAPSMPCCVISRAAQPDQSIQWSTLGELADVVPGHAPVLLLTGWALADAATRHAIEPDESAPQFSAEQANPAHDF